MSLLRRLLHADSGTIVGLHNAPTREKWVEAEMRSLPTGSRLLDAGAGECQFRRFCEHLQYVSQDFAQYDGSGDRSGLQTGKWDTSQIDLICDIVNIPEPDQSFDAILCTEVLEHLPEPQLALKEFARLLRPGGRLIMTAPFMSLTHFAPYHFATGFNRYFYLHHLEKHGFTDIEIIENGNFFEFIAQELRRVDGCARQYAGSRLSWFQRHAVNVLLAALERFSSLDRGSKELCNFDLQVTAVRSAEMCQ